MSTDPIKVNSVAEENAIIRNTPCDNCGGQLKKIMQAVEEGPVDYIQTKCANCGKEREFYFDISSFYGQQV